MPNIASFTLPSGTTYDLKDETARNDIATLQSAISSLNGFDYIVCSTTSNTPYMVSFTSGISTITGILTASASTMHKIYLVPSTNGTNDTYDEYITVETGESGSEVYSWEMFGNTDVHLSDLGDLAYADTVEGSITPTGTISVPNLSKSKSTQSISSVSSNGSVTAGTAARCTFPELTMSVENEVLTFSWTDGSFTANTPTGVTLPSTESVSVVTDYDVTIAAPTFTGDTVYFTAEPPEE